MIQAVFWDYDNTLIETKEAHWQKHKIVLSRHGIKLDPIYKQQVYENNGNQNWEWMTEALGLKVLKKKYLSEIDYEFLNYIQKLELRPGVKEALELLKAKKIPQAIITNARKESAQPVLEKKQLTPYMQFVLFKEDYEGRKPDPAPYRRGFEEMERLTNTRITPSNCLAIEDDPKGVESAYKAGAIVIHRKLYKEDADSLYAHHSCFEESDFIKTIKRLLA